MLIFKLKSQTTDEVTRIFETLQVLIPLDIYKNLLQIILTDNGHEFFDNAVLILFYSFVTFKFQIIIIKHSIY